MSFVLDTSVAMAWLMRDEESAAVDLLFDTIDGVVVLVPSLFWYEIRNALAVTQRRDRADGGYVIQSIGRMRQLRLETVEMAFRDDLAIFRAAATHRLTGHDATYLVLAQRMGLAIATGGKALRRAAFAAGIPLTLS